MSIDFQRPDGPYIQGSSAVASTGWFIGMMLALALLLLVLVLVCIIKRNRGGKYAVHEREATHGRKDFNEDAGFHEYSQPYVNEDFQCNLEWWYKKIFLGGGVFSHVESAAVGRLAKRRWAAVPKCHPRAKITTPWPNTEKEKPVKAFIIQFNLCIPIHHTACNRSPKFALVYQSMRQTPTFIASGKTWDP